MVKVMRKKANSNSVSIPKNQYSGKNWYFTGNAIIYIDGVLDVTKDMSTKTFETKTTTVRNIGRVGNGSSARHWDGRFDDLGVWDRQITGPEVTELFNKGFSGNGILAPSGSINSIVQR